MQEGKNPSWNFCRCPGAPWAPNSWVFHRSQVPQHPHISKELWFSPQILQKTTGVSPSMVLPAQPGRLIPEEIPAFPAGTHSLEVMVASDSSTNPELRFKYLISKGIWISSVFFIFFDSYRTSTPRIAGKSGMREKTQKAEKVSVLLLCCFVVLF